MAKVELPESWADVAEPLRALMAEVEREAHAGRTTPPDIGRSKGRSFRPVLRSILDAVERRSRS
jgi:hypothetical protein